MVLDVSRPSTPSSSRSTSSTRNRLLANNFIQSTMKALSSAPLFHDTSKVSVDDQMLGPPKTPKRPGIGRGLSLQLPKQDLTSPSTSKFTTVNTATLSPKLDPSIAFSSSVIPRRSRGLDFSRACTNLHHSTLAESSPDSSPVVGGRGMAIPRRSGTFDSPMTANGLWSTVGSERMLGTSIGSNAMETSDSSDTDEDMMREEEDIIHMTPQPMRTSFNMAHVQSPGFDPMANSPAGRRLSNFARRFKIKTRRKLPIADSPGNLSPPLTRSNEPFWASQSRRESLSLGTTQLNLSDDVPQDPLGVDLSDPQVVRRAVTRRSNMLPKPKGFARIRAALQEESCPIENESKHEAAVIRHVRESDGPGEAISSTEPCSPSLAPMNSNEAIEELTSIMSKPRDSANFGRHAMRNSGGPEFWENWDERMRTPPPPFPQRTNSTVSEDVSMETNSSHPPSLQHFPSNSSPSRSSTPQPMEMRKALGKRRRDDDFDPSVYKRRAVSPGLSHQNSPVIPPSPTTRDGMGGWQAKVHRESSASSSGTPATAGKRASRVGMQGMTDTSDGLMNMSIE